VSICVLSFKRLVADHPVPLSDPSDLLSGTLLSSSTLPTLPLLLRDPSSRSPKVFSVATAVASEVVEVDLEVVAVEAVVTVVDVVPDVVGSAVLPQLPAISSHCRNTTFRSSERFSLVPSSG